MTAALGETLAAVMTTELERTVDARLDDALALLPEVPTAVRVESAVAR